MTDQDINQRFVRIADSIEHLAQAQLDTDREINALASVQRDVLESLRSLHEITAAHSSQASRLDAAMAELARAQADTERHLQAYLTTVHPRQ